MIVFHEVAEGTVWANAWKEGPGSRQEMFDKIGVRARIFKDPQNGNLTGLILEIPDMAAFQSFMETDEARRAMEEDGLKLESVRMLTEFTP